MHKRREGREAGTGRVRTLWPVLALWPASLAAQSAMPLLIGRPILVAPPAVDARGQNVAFASAITPQGSTVTTTDVYVAAADGTGVRRLTHLAGGAYPPRGATAVSLAADARVAAFTVLAPNRSEEVHVMDVASGTDRTVAVDTLGCIQPLALCPNCFITCLHSPHFSHDGSKVLYSVSRSPSFYVVNVDGTDLAPLPVYTGTLAPGPQRVASRNGQVVFTSSAPMGPTFAASATDVYVMNLDGTEIQAVTKFGNNYSIFTWNATISADGGTIAFETNYTGAGSPPGQNSQIWLVHTDGTGLRALTSGTDASSNPSLSADGSLVTFARSGQIYISKADGTGLKALTNFQMSFAQDPAISDDGSRVVFSLGPRSGDRGAVYSVSSDGSNLRPVYAPPALNPNGIVTLGSNAPPSAGALITAYGMNLTSDSLASAGSFPLPETLAGLSLLVNGIPAPLLAVTPWQINAQLPPEVPQAPASFQLRFADGATPAAVAADVQSVSPVIFSYAAPTTDQQSTYQQAAAFHAGTAVPADWAHPAAAGEVLETYGTGLGLTDPFVAAGIPAPASPVARTQVQPQVVIGNLTAQVLFAGLTPGLAGVYQVNVVVPSGLPPGPYAIFWNAGSATGLGWGSITLR